MPAPQQIDRFRGETAASVGGRLDKLGLAVSGGADSLALLLLAQAAFPGAVQAVTVDHGLRPESTAEARHVAAICAALGVPHHILTLSDLSREGASVQARARTARYAAMAGWLAKNGGEWLATGHHMDDQAETVLMRLNRGAGAGGLAGIRRKQRLKGSAVSLVRPLLGWRRAELAAIVEAAGLKAVDDPSNRDRDYDRTRYRDLLAGTPLLDAERLAAAAANLADADEALEWVAAQAWAERRRTGDKLEVDATGLPRELRRRLLVRAIDAVRSRSGLDGEWRKDGVVALLDHLDAGGSGNLAGVMASGGAIWRFKPEPPRRRS